VSDSHLEGLRLSAYTILLLATTISESDKLDCGRVVVCLDGVVGGLMSLECVERRWSLETLVVSELYLIPLRLSVSTTRRGLLEWF